VIGISKKLSVGTQLDLPLFLIFYPGGSMASPLPEDFQREFNTVRNKQIEVFDRIAELEGQIRQFTERMGKLEDVVARLESNSQRKQPYQR
jgi:hypothetical protein